MVLRMFKIKKIVRIAMYATVPMSLFAMAISGVTGFIVLIVLGVILGISYSTKRFVLLLLSLAPTLFIMLVVVIKLGVYISPLEKKDTSLYRTIYMLGGAVEYDGSGKTSTAGKTMSAIAGKMYFLPDSLNVFLFGRGGSGRSEDYVVY